MRRTRLGFAMRAGLAVLLASAVAAADAPVIVPVTSATPPRWAKQFGSGQADRVTGVAVATDGTIVVAGDTLGGMVGAVNAGGTDIFVAAFGANGDERWLRQFGGSGFDRATGVAVDAQGFAYASGFTSNRMPAGSSEGAGDAFLVKLDRDGGPVWLRQFGTTGADFARSVAVDGSGNVYVGGDTNGTLPENRNYGGDGDAFIAKFDASGDVVWVRQFGSEEADFAYGIGVGATARPI